MIVMSVHSVVDSRAITSFVFCRFVEMKTRKLFINFHSDRVDMSGLLGDEICRLPTEGDYPWGYSHVTNCGKVTHRSYSMMMQLGVIGWKRKRLCTDGSHLCLMESTFYRKVSADHLAEGRGEGHRSSNVC